MALIPIVGIKGPGWDDVIGLWLPKDKVPELGEPFREFDARWAQIGGGPDIVVPSWISEKYELLTLDYSRDEFGCPQAFHQQTSENRTRSVFELVCVIVSPPYPIVKIKYKGMTAIRMAETLKEFKRYANDIRGFFRNHILSFSHEIETIGRGEATARVASLIFEEFQVNTLIDEMLIHDRYHHSTWTVTLVHKE